MTENKRYQHVLNLIASGKPLWIGGNHLAKRNWAGDIVSLCGQMGYVMGRDGPTPARMSHKNSKIRLTPPAETCEECLRIKREGERKSD